MYPDNLVENTHENEGLVRVERAYNIDVPDISEVRKKCVTTRRQPEVKNTG
jgi:hypothetical protein